MSSRKTKAQKIEEAAVVGNTLLAEGLIKQYLKDNLSIAINVETNDFLTTDGSTRTRVTVSIAIDGEEICSDSYKW